MYDSTTRTIQNVRHVEGSNKNLLSIGVLDDLRCRVEIENRIMKIIRGALLLIKAQKIAANLYMLLGKTLQEVKTCVALEDSSEKYAMLWHRKLGHMSEQ